MDVTYDANYVTVSNPASCRGQTTATTANENPLLGTGTGDDRNRHDVRGSVAEGYSETQGQEDGKSKDPEDDLGLALEFQQASGKEMGVARPAVIAGRRRG